MSQERRPRGREKIDKVKKKLGHIPFLRRLLNNTWLKLISLVFAIVLWSVVMSQTNPPRSKPVYDVPVSVEGAGTLTGRGLAVSNSDEFPQSVNVTLEVPMNDLSSVSVDTVTAKLSLQNITKEGTYTLPVTISSVYGTPKSSTVSRVKVEVETRSSPMIPVQIKSTGQVSDNYRMGAPTITPAQFQIYGPQSVVDHVAAAVVNIDYSRLTQDYNQSLLFNLVDKNGVAMDMTGIESSVGNTVNVQIPVYPVKEVPIEYEDSLMGALPEGFSVESVEVTPTTVRVAASRSVLAKLDSISLSAIDIQGATNDLERTVSLKKPGDVYWMDVQEADVVVRVKEQEATKVFTDVPVKVLNLSDGFSADTYDATVDVEITTARSVLNNLTRDNIVAYVDLASDKEATERMAAVTITLRGVNADYICSATSDKILVKITKQA